MSLISVDLAPTKRAPHWVHVWGSAWPHPRLCPPPLPLPLAALPPLTLPLLLPRAAALPAEYHCKSLGAQRMAYPPVVASGPDAFFTHYGRNDKQLKPGQLLLMDAGCELHG